MEVLLLPQMKEARQGVKQAKRGEEINTGNKSHGCEPTTARMEWIKPRSCSQINVLTLNGLADALSSLPDMNLAFCLVSFNLSITGGFTNTTNGLSSAVRRCFIIWAEEKEQTFKSHHTKKKQLLNMYVVSVNRGLSTGHRIRLWWCSLFPEMCWLSREKTLKRVEKSRAAAKNWKILSGLWMCTPG